MCDYVHLNSNDEVGYMEYLSVRQTAEKWGLSTKRIQFICKQGRIPGAFIIGNSWAIPADAEKPKDARIKSGRYIKRQEAMYGD